MNCMKRWLPYLLLLIMSTPVWGQTGDRGHGMTLVWPSTRFRTLQSALDAAPDGATIQITAGVYQITSPLTVQGKQLTIVGEGSGRGRGKDARISELDGPPPQPVVDERGAIVLPADAVQGLWNLLGADVTIADMKITGFDAGIVTRMDNAGRSGPTTVRNVVISSTGRGILSLSSADLKVSTSTIINTQWNGISFAPPKLTLAPPPRLTVLASTIAEVIGAGIWFSDGFGLMDEVQITGAALDGIHGYESNCIITLSTISNNAKSGIELDGGHCTITGIVISNTTALGDGLYGDGIYLSATGGLVNDADVAGSQIYGSARASLSLFGGTATVTNN